MANNTVQNIPRSQKVAPRVFPPLPCSKEKLKLLKKFRFQWSDLIDCEHIQLCKRFAEKKLFFYTSY